MFSYVIDVMITSYLHLYIKINLYSTLYLLLYAHLIDTKWLKMHFKEVKSIPLVSNVVISSNDR